MNNEVSDGPGRRRVALVSNSSLYLGPDLARVLAARGHDLVLGDPADGLVDELEAAGTAVEVVKDCLDLADPESSRRLIGAGLDRFGQIDSATMFSGVIVVGSFLDSSRDNLRSAIRGALEAPYNFLREVVPPMVEQGAGQVLVVTSSTGARPTIGAPLYSAARAGANHLVRNVAAEVASSGVQVNALGTNFMDFPEFRRATGADNPEIRAKIEEQVPMGRLGTMQECAELCAAFVDGACGFMSGQFVGVDGAWTWA